MNATLFTTLLTATALATLVWIVRQKKHDRPWKARWLLAIGLLAMPALLMESFAPADWEATLRTWPRIISTLIFVPFLAALAALVGGVIVLLAPIVGAFFSAFGEIEMDWSDASSQDDDSGYDIADPVWMSTEWTPSYNNWYNNGVLQWERKYDPFDEDDDD
ncbi:MAG: hypothetical protein KZQ86_07570 [Candidatus Thiodiazotropha sp. (ex Lucinoma kastoroae)]|nr:hypothetical protein [Candidatus Thiodiazotropha sp. (ex Lucinoma kastoroae)]